MAGINIVTYNVRGINSPIKCANIMGELRSLKAEVVLLQETHLYLGKSKRIATSEFPYWIYGDSPIRGAKGVAIGFAKGVGFTIEERVIDPEGRFLFIRGSLKGMECSLANIYCPNNNQARFLVGILAKFETFKRGRAIIAGDFNICLEPGKDSTSRARGSEGKWMKKLRKKLRHQQLVDIWRMQHQNIRDYTFYSPVHATYSRLDLFFVEHRYVEEVEGTSIGPMTFSDHAPVSLQIKLSKHETRSSSWILNEDLLHDEKIDKLIKEELEFYFKVNTAEETSETMVWEAHKAYIRGIMIKAGVEKKRSQGETFRVLQEEIIKLEQHHKKKGDSETLAKLFRSREAIRQLIEQENRKKYNLVKKERYVGSNRPGRLLAKILSKKKNNKYIDKIRSRTNEIQYRDPDIARTFQEFYSELYSINRNVTPKEREQKQAKIKNYLSEVGMTKLSENEHTTLESPITEIEVRKAIRETQVGKSPGPDGLTVLYYKKYQDYLIPKLCAYMNDIGDKGEMSREALAANITVIQKEDKDATVCSNYRPISLLNVDTKLFAKVIASRMKQVIEKIIHPDQVGFIRGRQGRDNSIKTLLVAQEIKKSGVPGLLLSIDAEKAFDRVDWDFMMSTLEEVGCGERMCKWIRALYSRPSARVKINGTFSDPIDMYNGTRQGCPISPMLFLLTLEPLLLRIRQNRDISGVVIGNMEYKLAAFADDILLYITQPRISLPNIMANLVEYGKLSNFKVNPTKSEALEINHFKESDHSYQKHFPFVWGKKELNYLGVKITTSTETLYQANFIALLNEVKAELSRIHLGQLSWADRINIYKMVILPKITYKMQMIPITLPHTYLRRLHLMFSKFIWRGKPPRLKFSQLINTKGKGGWGAPDIRKYYEAIAIARVTEWVKNIEKQWVVIENKISDTKLDKIIWISPQQRKYSTETHAITKHAFKIWDTLHRKEHWEYNSPLMPLKDLEQFAPGKEEWFGKWLLEENIQLKDIMHRGRICSFQEMQDKRDMLVINPWRYSQLKHYVGSLPQPIRSVDNLTPLEKICVDREGRGGFSRIYKVLVDLERLETPDYIGKWEKELGRNLTDTDVSLILKRVSATSVNSKLLELNFKCLTRMYLTPDRVHKIHRDKSQFCWRGCSEMGSMAHIWWLCPEMKRFWGEVRKFIKVITNLDVPNDPWICLFHMSDMPTKTYLRTLLPHLIDAAKSLIPKYWQRKERPKMREWFNKINEIQCLEYLRFSEGTKMGAFETKWKDWEKFKESPNAVEMWST